MRAVQACAIVAEMSAGAAKTWERLLPDAAATVRLGEAIGARLQQGDAVLLSGELGAGKTTLARGLAAAWTGQDEEAPSPTYTLVQTYEGPKGMLSHMDLYRLNRPEDVFELGLEEALEFGATVIEWPERLGPYTPSRPILLRLTPVGEARVAHFSGRDWLAELAA